MRITLHSGPVGAFRVVAADGRHLLVQSDWDFPGLAASFGWQPCWCGLTDGTIECEHRTVDAMLTEARQYLDDRIGNVIHDPGYF